MTHRFPIKEIARQAALSTATVDRVLNGRAHVSPQTRNRVQAAIGELTRPEAQWSARGRRLFVDIVVESRFSTEIRRAAEAVLPGIGAGVFRPRFMFGEVMGHREVVEILARILKRGSHGVCLKARDVPEIREMVERLSRAGIPVVTLVTDIPGSARTAYVGLDNSNAGRTAAYLMARMLGGQGGVVLTTRSQETFFGEAERHAAFCAAMAEQAPDIDLEHISGGAGGSAETARMLAARIGGLGGLRGVYSMGGGNRAIVGLLTEHGFRDLVFVAHDLDAENRDLLAAGRIGFVLHHDLETDMRNVFAAFSAHWKLVAEGPSDASSDIQVITPFNLPAARSG